MDFHRSTVIVLVVVVLLAGCNGIGGTDEPTDTPETSDVSTPTNTTTEDGSNSDGTTTDDGPLWTTNDTWSEPEPPHTPLDHSTEDGRISNVRIVNAEESGNGNGYSNFDVEIVANTTMKNVDPEPNVNGDPYFYVKINDQPVARNSLMFQHDRGTYTVEIHPGALEQFGAGTLDVEVLLLDSDKARDDVYGTAHVTVEYSPASNGTAGSG